MSRRFSGRLGLGVMRGVWCRRRVVVACVDERVMAPRICSGVRDVLCFAPRPAAGVPEVPRVDVAQQIVLPLCAAVWGQCGAVRREGVAGAVRRRLSGRHAVCGCSSGRAGVCEGGPRSVGEFVVRPATTVAPPPSLPRPATPAP